ncbi:hypothetical protein BDZ45DRAFT_746485 [Acephala macrosclerotiorum]|nr:hypothetical protein BDZ45DRAFT_746485 [Acephala macrosclerotiorum]
MKLSNNSQALILILSITSITSAFPAAYPSAYDASLPASNTSTVSQARETFYSSDNDFMKNRCSPDDADCVDHFDASAPEIRQLDNGLLHLLKRCWYSHGMKKRKGLGLIVRNSDC